MLTSERQHSFERSEGELAFVLRTLMIVSLLPNK